MWPSGTSGVKELPEELAPQEAKSGCFFFNRQKPTVLSRRPRCEAAASLRGEMEASCNHKGFLRTGNLSPRGDHGPGEGCGDSVGLKLGFPWEGVRFSSFRKPSSLWVLPPLQF